jgi:hypothetical protein
VLAKLRKSVKASTQSLAIKGTGDRLLKYFLNRLNGARIEDLLLKDVLVVEGFYINIVLEARLKKLGL